MTETDLAREAGKLAFTQGKKESDCPYSKYSDKGAAWLRGYSTARFGALMAPYG